MCPTGVVGTSLLVPLLRWHTAPPVRSSSGPAWMSGRTVILLLAVHIGTVGPFMVHGSPYARCCASLTRDWLGWRTDGNAAVGTCTYVRHLLAVCSTAVPYAPLATLVCCPGASCAWVPHAMLAALALLTLPSTGTQCPALPGVSLTLQLSLYHGLHDSPLLCALLCCGACQGV
jgi:hypothetical protein